MNQLVSVIIPVYNVEKYLARCLNSVISQTYRDLEIILVNDGSTDNSGRICNQYKERDPRIIVIHKENEGLGLTRNCGISKASGSFFTFVDSDDYLPLDAIEYMVDKLISEDADLVIGNYYYGDIVKDFDLAEGCYREDEIKNSILMHMLGNYPKNEDLLSVSAWGKLYKAKIISENSIRYPSERRLIWEDIVFNFDYIPHCSSVYVSHKPVYYYCFNEVSLTHKYNPQKLNLVMTMYEYMAKKVNELGLGKEANIRLNNGFIGHIRTCLKLEVNYKKQNGFKKSYENLKKICDDQRVIDLIESFEPANYTTVQSIYSKMILQKKYLVVYLLTWLQLKRKRIE